jgi:hypothetical protein
MAAHGSDRLAGFEDQEGVRMPRQADALSASAADPDARRWMAGPDDPKPMRLRHGRHCNVIGTPSGGNQKTDCPAP